ncbi:MAG: hypothetical protein AAB592_05420 [Patescibacteria group bacterium]
MTKVIGIKELQTGTRKIREGVENGTRYVVLFRSKPIFEIHPMSGDDIEELHFNDEEIIAMGRKLEKMLTK